MLKFLAAGTHLGGTNLDFQMEQYVYKRKSDGKRPKKGAASYRFYLAVNKGISTVCMLYQISKN